MRVCNRRSTAGTGTPTQVADGMYTAAQINSLLANYYTSVQVDDLVGGYALTNHNHDAIYASITHTHEISDVIDFQITLDAKADASTVSGHLADTENPHSVTKIQLGLENVDNTSDMDKPVSTAQQTAINAAMEGGTAINGHIADTNNPHAVMKTQLGLGNVDNTADTDKPISTAMQTALDGKLTATFSGIQVIVNGSEISYHAGIDELVAFLNSLDEETAPGVHVKFPPGTDFSTDSDVTFPHISMVMEGGGNNYEIAFNGGLDFLSTVTLRDMHISCGSGSINLRNCYIENSRITGDILCSGAVNMSFVNVNGNIVGNSYGSLICSRCGITGRISAQSNCVLTACNISCSDAAQAAITSTGGQLIVADSFIINAGGGGDISCANLNSR